MDARDQLQFIVPKRVDGLSLSERVAESGYGIDGHKTHSPEGLASF